MDRDYMTDFKVVDDATRLLNACFLDIEKFICRLHLTASANRHMNRNNSGFFGLFKNKDDLMKSRARPPPADDFVDIFKKFKFSINILAKLRNYIIEPRSPEVIQYLFTPLSLLYEASRDPIHEGRDLGAEAVSPLFVPEAIALMRMCLRERDVNLLHKMGRSWEISSADWRGYVPPYSPVFYNGSKQPPQRLVEQIYRLEEYPDSKRYNDGGDWFGDGMRRHEGDSRWFEDDADRYMGESRMLRDSHSTYNRPMIMDEQTSFVYGGDRLNATDYTRWNDEYY